MVGVGRDETHSLLFVVLVELDVEVGVDGECDHAVTTRVLAVLAEDQGVVNHNCVDAPQGISCRLSLVFGISWKVIVDDVGLLLLDVDDVIVNIQLHGLGVYQNGVDLHPRPHLKDELFRIGSKGYRLAVPVYQLDA